MLLAKDRNWYVVYGKAQKEQMAEFHLQKKGVQVFFPRLRLPQTRRRKRIIPLFPNYFFVKINFAEECHYVRWSPGVKHFVCFNDTPIPMDTTVVNFLLDQADSEGVLMARSNLKTGQQIRIEHGPFEGLVGIIQDPPDPRGRVKVLMSFLNREMRVELPLHVLKSDWQADSEVANANNREAVVRSDTVVRSDNR